jgi:hypothetical protein
MRRRGRGSPARNKRMYKALLWFPVATIVSAAIWTTIEQLIKVIS